MRAEAGGESDDRGGPEGDQAGAAAGGGGVTACMQFSVTGAASLPNAPAAGPRSLMEDYYLTASSDSFVLFICRRAAYKGGGLAQRLSVSQ